MDIRNTIDSFMKKQKEQQESRKAQEEQIVTKPNDFPLLATYIGQEKAIMLLSVLCASSSKSSTALEHILISGLPGLGKSRLAQAISNEVDGLYKKVFGSSLKSKYDLAPIFAFLQIKHPRKILFIDEIHSISRKIAEELYDITQEFNINGMEIDKFTLIGATTYPGDIDEALRQRFTVPITLEPYASDDLSMILSGLYEDIDTEIIEYICERSKGIIRIAIQYTKMLKQVACGEKPTMQDAEFVMECIGVRDNGLTESDIKVLRVLRSTLRPLSKNSICAMARVDDSEYNHIIEPILLNIGFIAIQSNGRLITLKGLHYLKSIGE